MQLLCDFQLLLYVPAVLLGAGLDQGGDINDRYAGKPSSSERRMGLAACCAQKRPHGAPHGHEKIATALLVGQFQACKS